jgi:hypothetical protein
MNKAVVSLRGCGAMAGAWKDKTRTLEDAQIGRVMELPAERPTLHGNNNRGLLWLFTAAAKVDASDPVRLLSMQSAKQKAALAAL